MTSWTPTVPQQHLKRATWLQLWSLVDYVRQTDGDLYREFLHGWTIIDFTVDYFAAGGHARFKPLIEALRERVQRESNWLVEVPLLNLVPPRDAIPLGPRAILVQANPDRQLRFGPSLDDPWVVRRHLGDELTPRPRWLVTSRADDVDVDTRTTASLLLVEEGLEELAVDRASTRARLAVAMWCLLAPPGRRYDPRQPWPTVGGWTPGRFIEFGSLRKLYEPNAKLTGQSRRRGTTIAIHSEYRLTRNNAYLQAPFEALEHAMAGNICALALLSAARSLYLAEQIPNDLDRPERAFHVWQAKEALSDPGQRGGDSEKRWRRLVVNLRLHDELRRRGYRAAEVEEAAQLVETLRDLAAHRPHDVLVNLGFPRRLQTQMHKSRVVDAETAALVTVTAQWPVLLVLVRTAARRLAKQAIANNWDERWFHSRFS
jgi:hypothetical protein